MQKIIRQIASEIKVTEQQVTAAVELLDGGATVPFIARYRKEVTNGLDDIQLRELEARLSYLRELEDRREAVFKAIDEQGKLTDALRAALPAHRPNKSWKTSTCRLSKNAAPRARLRASSASSRWPTNCLPTPHSTPLPRLRPLPAPPKCWTTANRGLISRPCPQCWTVCVTS